MAKSTRQPKLKPTDRWAEILAEEVHKPNPFTEHHRSFTQLQELRRMAGLPCGKSATYAWVSSLLAQGKIRRDRGTVGTQGNVCRYIFL